MLLRFYKIIATPLMNELEKIQKQLRLKIPPIAVFLITVSGISLTGLLLGETSLSLSVRWGWFIVFAVIGSGIAILGVKQFRKAQTSFSPRKPSEASCMVSSGIFAIRVIRCIWVWHWC